MSLRGIAIETLKLPALAPLARLLYRRFFTRQRKGNHYHGVYASYADALRAVPASLLGSYDNADAAARYRERTRQLSIGDYPVLYWVSRLLDEGNRRVFDLGGHIGVAYYAFQHYRAFPVDLQWTVSDLPTTMDAGRAWAQAHDPAGRLSFADDKQRADGQDVLLVLGAMQYFDYDFASWLRTLSRPPAHLLVNLTPMHPTRDFHTLQNMGFACVPYRIHARPAFLEAMARLGYRVVDAWRNDDRRCRIPFAHDHDVDGYSGFYLRREHA
ncbi:MAG TPA: TIGR04325 family methyltransferase [Frateuria sp.]|uniref:TIGR04325 family methyltransferase n=1 Tax=Frateuria sp. TaxID=2211372 RepID=UPI002DF17AAF|nr:TIGR04325 family methyltransferase [Frateuria sp.]